MHHIENRPVQARTPITRRFGLPPDHCPKIISNRYHNIVYIKRKKN